MDINNELLQYNVSRETIKRLESFADILREWNEKMNLVSRNSFEVLWERHILDSLQLINYISPSVKSILDIGSGAGFPAMILAIVLKEKMPHVNLTLVESIAKKTMYLNDVRSRLGLDNVLIENSRVENGVFKSPDLITARAVASLDVLCGYVAKVGGKNTKALFLKGKSYLEEVAIAQKFWKFDLEVFPNKYSEDGVVLQLSQVRKIK